MGIVIQIKAGKDAAGSSIAASGSTQHVITDRERSSFGLDEASLKRAVGAYFGKEPSDAFLSDPTPWDNLYRTYHWSQVATILTVKSAQIVDLVSHPAVLKTTTLRNMSRKAGGFSASVQDNVTTTAETTWSTGVAIEHPHSVQCSIELASAGNMGGFILWGFSQAFGVRSAQNRGLSVGSDLGEPVELEPGEAVDVQLSATHGVLKARVLYDVHLVGTTAIHYQPAHKGHPFWALDIGAVMRAGGMATHHTITQDIVVGYYANAEVKRSGVARMPREAPSAPVHLQHQPA
ncbi:MAG TPA: hypothetical protein VND93_14705 [Myxococcales bacterium]|nr:hypothetical protein [Myxococcales bacterium]